jgi:hypothetical protein
VLCVGKLVFINVNHGKKYAKEHAGGNKIS